MPRKQDISGAVKNRKILRQFGKGQGYGAVDKVSALRQDLNGGGCLGYLHWEGEGHSGGIAGSVEGMLCKSSRHTGSIQLKRQQDINREVHC